LGAVHRNHCLFIPDAAAAFPHGSVRNKDMNERIVRRPQVESQTGLSRSTIYSKMADGTFPKPVKLGENSVGWKESEIQNWIAALSQGDAA
jgi:prophage regulatory protein